MATYPIRQLADNGGTAPFVPVTAPEAVQFPDGSNLNTLIGSIATIESNPVAANHAVGEFLCINGQVYEVIDAIAAGDSISLGENVNVANLGSQITALNNGLAQSSVLETLAYTDVTATRTTLTLIGDRKLSDYKIVVLCAFDGLQLVNGSTLINRSSFTSGYSMYVHGYSLINYNGSALCRYVNDTTVSMEAVELNGWTSMRCILYGLR